MKINKNNYEIWFLDYYEGRLTPAQVEELMAFLDRNYTLKEEFKDFENIILPPAKKVVFDAKDKLKRSAIIPVSGITEENYETFFIAETEGDLSIEESKQLVEFLEKNPSLKKELELFKKTKLTADNSIIFDKKDSLKKEQIIPVGNINAKNYQDYFIADAENDLKLTEISELKKFFSVNPQLKKESDLFRLLKITPDKSIVFDRKEQLKKAFIPVKTYRLRNLYYAVSAAASIIIIVTAYVLFRPDKTSTGNFAYVNKQEINAHIKKSDNINVKKASETSELAAIPHTTKENSNNNIITTNSNNIIAKAVAKPSDNNKPAVKNIETKIINTNKNEELQYAKLLKPKMLPVNIDDAPMKLKENKVAEELYAFIQKKIVEPENTQQVQNDDDKYLSLKDLGLFKLKKSIVSKDKKEKIKPTDKITTWDVAEAGVSKINKITKADIKLQRTDKEYTLALGNLFEISGNR